MSSYNNLSSKISCKKCCKAIAKTRRFMTCQQCESQFHIKCYNTDSSSSKTNKDLPEICSQCEKKSKKCGKCSKAIGKNHRYINCSKCYGKYHLKCNETDEKTYNQMKINQPILCINCKPDNLPFPNLSDTMFF